MPKFDQEIPDEAPQYKSIDREKYKNYMKGPSGNYEKAPDKSDYTNRMKEPSQSDKKEFIGM